MAKKKGYVPDNPGLNQLISIAGSEDKIQASIVWQSLLLCFHEMTGRIDDLDDQEKMSLAPAAVFMEKLLTVPDDDGFENIADRMQRPMGVILTMVLQAIMTNDGGFFRELADVIDQGPGARDPIRFCLSLFTTDEPLVLTESELRRVVIRIVGSDISPGRFHETCKEMGIRFK